MAKKTNPFKQLGQWLRDARKAGIQRANGTLLDEPNNEGIIGAACDIGAIGIMGGVFNQNDSLNKRDEEEWGYREYVDDEDSVIETLVGKARAEKQFDYPCGCYNGIKSSVSGIIPHLNDSHHEDEAESGITVFTSEQVADWLESLDK
jgi:hypothetical protein